MAEQLGVFIGAVLGVALKHCAPVLAAIIAEGIKSALKDTAETGKPSAGDPQQSAFERLLAGGNQNHPAKAGDGGNADEGSQGRDGHGA